MTWRLSKYLNEIEFRGADWCFVDMGRDDGVHVARSDYLFIHLIIEGACRLTAGADQVVECKEGDVAIVVSGEAHKIRNANGKPMSALQALTFGEASDTPAKRRADGGAVESRVLTGRIDLVWPLGNRPSRMPPVLFAGARDAGLDFAQYVEEAGLRGGSAVLTALARLLFIRAVRDNPICWRQFELKLDDPITRAKVLIEKYPFQPWTVGSLAAEVGMGRSNFATKFAQRFGLPPIGALTEERMKHAAELLSDTRFKVSEVSDRTGYQSEAAFIGRFKDYFGMTPAKWRSAQARIGQGRAASKILRPNLWSQLSR